MPQQAFVTLKIYNVLGQEFAKLVDHKLMEAALPEAKFHASRLPSGVYFYRIVTERIGDEKAGAVGQTYVSVRKMVLLK